MRSDIPITDIFSKYDEVKRVLSKGHTRSSAVLNGGLQVDLRVVEDTSLGAALQYFTGSKAHSIAIRRLGQHRGLKLINMVYSKTISELPAIAKNQFMRRSGYPIFPRSCGKIEAKSIDLLKPQRESVMQ